MVGGAIKAPQIITSVSRDGVQVEGKELGNQVATNYSQGQQ